MPEPTPRVPPQKSLEEIIANVRGWCETHPVKLCAIFGSQATGKTHLGSDVDIAVWPLEEPAPLTRLRWAGELSRLLDAEVSLAIVTWRLDPVLGWEIAREGELVYEQDPGLWMHRRAQLWHAYNDALPFRRHLRQVILETGKDEQRR